MARLDVVPWSRAKIALASAIASPTSDRMAAHADQPRRSLGPVASLENRHTQFAGSKGTVTMRKKMRAPLGAAALVLALPGLGAFGAECEEVVEIATRNQQARALLLKPERPTGSVILLAGGHGNLGLGRDGRLGWGAGNQLVRTRADYSKAGFATLVPDIAPDLKRGSGGVPRYRWSADYARDIGAWVAHMRSIAGPVTLIGTSRAALSVAAAAARLSAGVKRPDA